MVADVRRRQLIQGRGHAGVWLRVRCCPRDTLVQLAFGGLLHASCAAREDNPTQGEGESRVIAAVQLNSRRSMVAGIDPVENGHARTDAVRLWL